MLIRRKENIVSISYNKNTYRMLFAGCSLSEKQRKQLHDMGLGISGEMCVINGTNVKTNNVTKLKNYQNAAPAFECAPG
jgi:hypothetical protein